MILKAHAQRIPLPLQCRNSDLVSMGAQSGIFLRCSPCGLCLWPWQCSWYWICLPPPNNENTRQNKWNDYFQTPNYRQYRSVLCQRRETRDELCLSWLSAWNSPTMLVKWRMVQLLWKIVSLKLSIQHLKTQRDPPQVLTQEEWKHMLMKIFVSKYS